jgi:hypothetical protein
MATRSKFGAIDMAELNRGERLQIMLTEGELAALDDWRFSRRMPSRAAAVRELLKRGLAAEGFLSAEQGAKSKDYGVVGGSEADDVAEHTQDNEPEAAGSRPGSAAVSPALT